jgi:phosphoglucosamine mutase
MNHSRKYFGTDGIRGVALEAPLDPETLVRLGKATASLFLARKAGRHRILIGKDTRLSGYMIETSLAAGLTSMGADVLLVGPLPTPAVAYLTKSMRVDAGIMVSASHNPYEDNGIKFFGPDGYKLPDEVELELEKLMDANVEIPTNRDPAKVGKAYRIDDAIGRYTVYLKSSFSRDFNLENYRIGLDCANGACYQVAPLTLEELGAEVVSRGISPNGRNINAGFGSLYPEVVRKLVLEQNLDLGIALDGDGDRLILVDEKGNVLDGDVILAICAEDYSKRGILKDNRLIATVMSNLGLEKFCKDRSIFLERSAVGDRYVLEKMQQTGAVLGGEQSGHVIFGDSSTTGDGLLTALKILDIMSRENKSLSELASSFTRFPQKLINIKVSSKPDLTTVPEVNQIIQDKMNELKDKGRIVVRYSGTENKARVMVECENEAECNKHASEVASTIEKCIGTV